jgi:hypothetical protein
VNQAILAWSFKKKTTGKRKCQYCLIHYIQLQLSIVNQAILAWSARSICLQLYLVNQAILAWLFKKKLLANDQANIA